VVSGHIHSVEILRDRNFKRHLVNPYVRYLKLICMHIAEITVAELILWCYTDQFGPKTQIGILHFSKLTQLHNSNTILELFSGSEYVYKMHAGILRENLEQYEMNASGYTLFKSVTVTGTVTVTHR
jgi:hypothetical protein